MHKRNWVFSLFLLGLFISAGNLTLWAQDESSPVIEAAVDEAGTPRPNRLRQYVANLDKVLKELLSQLKEKEALIDKLEQEREVLDRTIKEKNAAPRALEVELKEKNALLEEMKTEVTRLSEELNSQATCAQQLKEEKSVLEEELKGLVLLTESVGEKAFICPPPPAGLLTIKSVGQTSLEDISPEAVFSAPKKESTLSQGMCVVARKEEKKALPEPKATRKLKAKITSLKADLKQEKIKSQEELARAYIKAKDYRAAIAAYETALKLNRRNPKLYYYLGLLYAQDDYNPHKAVVYLRKYLKLKPKAEDRRYVEFLIKVIKGDR